MEHAAVTKEFLLAGRAIFTLELDEKWRHNEKIGPLDLKPHYTFRVEFKKGDDKWPDKYFVKILSGPENTRDYSYLGVLDKEKGEVRTTAKSTLRDDNMVVMLLNHTLARVWKDDVATIEKANFHVHHVGKCGRCGRPLTTPESVKRGIGPECIKHLGTPPEPEESE
jgi:hypothetical protein